MNKKKRKLTGKYFIVFLIYVFYSVAIHQEFHPFTMVPMFSSFPNSAYTYYVTDDKSTLVPIQEYFTLWAGGLGHKYFAFENALESEHKENLDKEIGNRLMTALKASQKKNIETDSISLFRKEFFWEDGEIKERDILLGRTKVNKN